MRKLANEELDRKSISGFKEATKTPIIIVLDNIRSLNNIGSVFRTSDAFLIEKIYLCGITATPPHNEIRKTALGATETVDWEHTEDCIALVKQLKEEKMEVFAVEQTENSIFLSDFKPKPNTKTVLVFGNEVKGVQQEVINNCSGVIEIPQLGVKHSLNIAVTTGIVIWDVFEKLKK